MLPVDKAAFKGEPPKEVTNLYPYSPFNLFIQRKLFMHNMSHALSAYLGYLRDYEYIYQAVGDYDIRYVAYKSLTASAIAIAKENGAEIDFLADHADNLLYRFTNTALADTVARVGKDTKRKLGENDRLIGALKLCEKHNVNANYICIGIAAAMLFTPSGDDSSAELYAYAEENGAAATLKKYSGYDGKYLPLIEELYGELKHGRALSALVKKCDALSNKTIKV